jgi:hypothetical protein
MKFYIVLGDWSKDGHGKSEKVLIDSNIPMEELQEAYKKSCKKTGFDFSENVCADYEDQKISQKTFDILVENNCPLDKEFFDYIGSSLSEPELSEDTYDEFLFTDKSLIDTLMWFIGLSIDKEWTWEEVGDEIPCFNGYWSDTLNVSFGYGLYE